MPDLMKDVATQGGELLLPFDPTHVIDNLRYERYTAPSNGGRRAAGPGLLPSTLYYAARPLLPIALRRHIQALYLRGWDKIPFPRWPVDLTVENLLEALLRILFEVQGVHLIPFIWFWPDGASSATVMTHDVETVAGRDRSPLLMDIDESFGIQSSFQVVPEGRYAVPSDFLNEIRCRGHELNVQDLNHDGRLFSSRKEFEHRVQRINEYGRDFGARGFRSAVLYHNLDWYESLQFEYDMSVPNIGHLEPQRGGCCTVFPYFVGDVLELPVTTTQDYSLFHVMRDYTLTLWRSQMNAIISKHGLASFIVHPDYLEAQRARDLYRCLLAFLDQCRTQKRMWVTTPGEVSMWWRQRNDMRLISDGRGWKIEGAGRERARIAYAFLERDRLAYRLADEDMIQHRKALS